MKILLVDGANNFLRNYAVVPKLNAEGDPIGGTYGFLISLASFVKITQPDRIYICWDGGSKKRRSIINDYKQNRKPKRLNRNYEFELENVEQNKIQQQYKLIQYLKNLPVTQIYIKDIEADDIIAYLCQYYENEECVIVSGDRDFYQLINNNITVFRPKNKEFITTDKCLEEYNIHPNNFALAKSIVGDPSDNIKGIKGIGFKKLIKLFPQFSSEEKLELKQLVENADKEDKKYKNFLENEQIVITNLRVIRLDESIISYSNIEKIHKAIESKPKLKIIPFRINLMKDGIMDIGDNFFCMFKRFQ